MTTLLLNCWSRSKRSLRFDPASGRGYVTRLQSGDGPVWGFAHQDRGVWHVVYAVGRTMVFQVGTATYPISPDVRCEVQGNSGLRTLRLYENTCVILQLSYRLPWLATLARSIEPTWDQIDEEQADFFFWLAARWKALSAQDGTYGREARVTS